MSTIFNEGVNSICAYFTDIEDPRKLKMFSKQIVLLALFFLFAPLCCLCSIGNQWANENVFGEEGFRVMNSPGNCCPIMLLVGYLVAKW